VVSDSLDVIVPVSVIPLDVGALKLNENVILNYVVHVVPVFPEIFIRILLIQHAQIQEFNKEMVAH